VKSESTTTSGILISFTSTSRVFCFPSSPERKPNGFLEDESVDM
jgi:hypothetical protein